MSHLVSTNLRPLTVSRHVWQRPRGVCLCPLGLCLLLLGGSSILADEKPSASTYAHEALLIEAKGLVTAPSRPGARLVLDVRTAEKFAESHLKEAVPITIADWTKDFTEGVDAERWARRFGELGIGRDTEVILYDDRAGQDAARIWWYLRYWGVCQARIVNGGWNALQAEKGLSFTGGLGRVPAVTTYSSPPVPARRIDLKAVAEAAHAKPDKSRQTDGLQLVDTRTDREFRGQQAAEGVRPGTIPGSRHLEWADLVDDSTGRFKTTSEVRQILSERGIDLGRPIVVFSNTRGRSSAISFPLELAGASQVRIFDAGYKAWAADANNPVNTSP